MTFSQRPAQARRRFLLVSVSALLIAGCAGGPRPGSPAGPAMHRVALLVPLSGAEGAVGQSIANAARLALADMNDRSIVLSVHDTAQGGAGVAGAQAIGQGARLILGPLMSQEVRAVQPVAARARVPVVAFTNDIAATGRGVFILGHVPGQSIERVVAHARRSGATRFAAIAPANVYGQRSLAAFHQAVRQSGGVNAGVETYGAGQARAAAGRMARRGGFDSLLIADDGRAALAAAPAVPAGIRLLGTSLWSGDGLGGTRRLRGSLYAAVPDSYFQQFAGRYRARYQRTPPRIASLGYDSMLLTVSVAKRWRAGRPFPIEALLDPKGFVGVDGLFRMGSGGVAERALEVRQVTASGTSLVSPAPGSLER